MEREVLNQKIKEAERILRLKATATILGLEFVETENGIQLEGAGIEHLERHALGNRVAQAEDLGLVLAVAAGVDVLLLVLGGRAPLA